jgi:hypothetical protein
VFPFELRVGDMIDDDGMRAEVVSPQKTGPAGKTTSAWTRRAGEIVQRQTVWDAWRKGAGHSEAGGVKAR